MTTVSARPQEVATPRAHGQLPSHARIVIVGAGFAGMGMAIKLREAGETDVVMLDRGDVVGGTWRDNTYPGAACDVPSRLYSFSFAQNPEWSRSFSPQPEIQAYLEKVARDYQLDEVFIGGVELLDADWQESQAKWELRTSAGTITADIFIAATGALSTPKRPDVPGLDTFPGKVIHSAEWDHGHDLTGERVAVIGTGASAIQIVPAIAEVAGTIELFQRTPPWVLPRADRAYRDREKRAAKVVPLAMRAIRAGLYYGHEFLSIPLTKQPALTRAAEKQAREVIAKQITDPELRRIVTPTYRLGCKRVLLSNEYYPALDRDNVHVLDTGLARVEGNTLIGNDGRTVQADTLVLATGFAATEPPLAPHIRGVGGRSLADSFGSSGMRALRGLAFAGFPNLFMLVGPNTGVGHTSMVVVIEAQVAYVLDALRLMREHGIVTLAPTERAVTAWNEDVQRRMQRTVWQTGGCASWYQDAHGRNTTLWPDTTIRFRRELSRVDLREYEFTGLPALTPTLQEAAVA